MGLDHLEAGIGRIEAAPGDQRQDEGRDRRDQRRPAGVGVDRGLVAALRQDEGGADQRQDQETGEDTEAEHHLTRGP